MTLFERTKEIAKRQGLSVSNLEKKANLSENSLYTWKKSTPKADTLEKVADVLHVSTDYLLGRTEQMNAFVNENTQKEVDIKNAIENDIMLAFDGKPISDKYKRIIIELLSEEE